MIVARARARGQNIQTPRLNHRIRLLTASSVRISSAPTTRSLKLVELYFHQYRPTTAKRAKCRPSFVRPRTFLNAQESRIRRDIIHTNSLPIHDDVTDATVLIARSEKQSCSALSRRTKTKPPHSFKKEELSLRSLVQCMQGKLKTRARK